MEIDLNNCVGCGQCLEICNVKAIFVARRGDSGYSQMMINQKKCIDCGECADSCPGEAIS